MVKHTYQYDERLAYAATPPSSWYIDNDILELEKRRIFDPTWQLIGRADMVAQPGTYFTTELCGESIIVVRDNDNKVRAFSNVCRHRAGPVTSGSGKCKTFRCGYHGWNYALDGRLLHTPEFNGVQCFNKDDYRLPEFQVEIFDQLIFVKLADSALTFNEAIGDLLNSLWQKRSLHEMQFAVRKDWYINCNWKVYIDNYLEGYHIPYVHPSLSRSINYNEYYTQTYKYHSIQYSPLKREGSVYEIKTSDNASDNEALFLWIFPNLIFNIYLDNFSTNLILPLGPDRTITIFEWYMRDPANEASKQRMAKIVEISDEIQLEDIKICETVQQGLRSRHYHQGRYSVEREAGVHHFHGLLNSFLGDLSGK